VSDRGREFLNEVIDKMLENSVTERKITSSFCPATNGITEHFNGTLVRALSKHAMENPRDWLNWIDLVLLADRTMVHHITGHTFRFN